MSAASLIGPISVGLFRPEVLRTWHYLPAEDIHGQSGASCQGVAVSPGCLITGFGDAQYCSYGLLADQ